MKKVAIITVVGVALLVLATGAWVADGVRAVAAARADAAASSTPPSGIRCARLAATTPRLRPRGPGALRRRVVRLPARSDTSLPHRLAGRR